MWHKPRCHLRIPCPRTLTCSNFHTEDPKMLGAAGQNLVTQVTWCPKYPGFVHPWPKKWNELALKFYCNSDYKEHKVPDCPEIQQN